MNLLATANAVNFNMSPASSTFASLTGITIEGLVSALIAIVLVVAGVIFFFMLVIGGIRWIASGGDKGQTEAARSQITAALIGLVIVFSAWAILSLIRAFFGVDLLNISLPTAITN